MSLLREAWREYERDHARYFATAMVYYALISLVPLVLLLLAALGLLLRFSDLAGAMGDQVLRTVEIQFGPELRGTVDGLFEQLQDESLVATAVSLVGMLLTASALFRHLRLSFRAIWKHSPPFIAGSMRGVVRATMVEYVMANVMILGGGVLLVAALVLISATQWVGGLLVRLPLLNLTPAWLLALPSSVLIIGLTFALLFRLLPPVRVRWRHTWLATTLCTAAWIIGAEILVVAGLLFGDSPSASGALGGILVLMLWLNVMSQILFFGTEVSKLVWSRENAVRPAGVPSEHP